MKILAYFSSMIATGLIYAAEPILINVNKNQSSFIVNLAANPTTGYQWSVIHFDNDLLTLHSSVYQRPNTKLIGAGGRMLFTFTLNKGKTYPQTTELTFKYARPWEKKDTGTIQKVTVNFESKDK